MKSINASELMFPHVLYRRVSVNMIINKRAHAVLYNVLVNYNMLKLPKS